MLSLGMLAALARCTARRSLKFIDASPPPCLAAWIISRLSLVKMAPRLASFAPFWRLMVDHLECPDIGKPSLRVRPPQAKGESSPRTGTNAWRQASRVSNVGGRMDSRHV